MTGNASNIGTASPRSGSRTRRAYRSSPTYTPPWSRPSSSTGATRRTVRSTFMSGAADHRCRRLGTARHHLWAALGLFLLLVLLAAIGPLLWPHGPLAMDFAATL